MKKWIALTLSLLFFSGLMSQQAVYDLFTYTPPKGWKRSEDMVSITYSITDNRSKNWCQLILCKKLVSTGTIESDFLADWNELVVKNYKGAGTPEKSGTEEADGWKIQSGAGKWTFNKKEVATVMTTFSGFGLRASIICNTTSQQYIPELEKLLSTLTLKKGDLSTEKRAVEKQETIHSTGFVFTNTRFDDGWQSTVRENWVETIRGSVTVKIHYPNTRADEYNSVLKTGDLNAWDILVAPYYSQIRNFNWRSIQSYESISFMEADALEISSGRIKHIVLFKKHYSNGNGRYLEFITDTKTDLENEFGPYHNTSYDWDKYANLQYRNKFAVAPGDLLGTWSANDYASLTYYYVNTGATASTTATSNSHQFTFLAGNKYTSEYAGASGQVGNMKFSTQAYSGKSTVTDWNIILTNRFRGETEKYEAQFEAIKGGRILIMTDRLGTIMSLVRKQ